MGCNLWRNDLAHEVCIRDDINLAISLHCNIITELSKAILMSLLIFKCRAIILQLSEITTDEHSMFDCFVDRSGRLPRETKI